MRHIPLELAVRPAASFLHYDQYVLLHSLATPRMRALVDRIHLLANPASSRNISLSNHRAGDRIGGAWNASIVAEYFHFRGETISTTGLGAIISQATDAGNFRLLLAATVVMAMIAVAINRLVWRRFLAATRYRLEA